MNEETIKEAIATSERKINIVIAGILKGRVSTSAELINQIESNFGKEELVILCTEQLLRHMNNKTNEIVAKASDIAFQ